LSRFPPFFFYTWSFERVTPNKTFSFGWCSPPPTDVGTSGQYPFPSPSRVNKPFNSTKYATFRGLVLRFIHNMMLFRHFTESSPARQNLPQTGCLNITLRSCNLYPPFPAQDRTPIDPPANFRGLQIKATCRCSRFSIFLFRLDQFVVRSLFLLLGFIVFQRFFYLTCVLVMTPSYREELFRLRSPQCSVFFLKTIHLVQSHSRPGPPQRTWRSYFFLSLRAPLYLHARYISTHCAFLSVRKMSVENPLPQFF